MKQRLALLAIWFICLVVSLISSLWMLASIVAGSPRAWQLALGYDRLGNIATGGSGKETVSSRANRGRSEGAKGWCILCRLLDYIDNDHCRKSAGV